MVNYHLVVLVHGIWGNSSHMGYLASQIEQQCQPSDPSEALEVYVTGSHAGYLTYDGIDVNGKRISDEIVQKAHALEDGPGKITKFSLIGYSMGGLVSRYALGVLYHQGFFEDIQPCHFATFCTPHVGALNPSRSLSSRLFNTIAPHVLAQTGSHFFLKDTKFFGDKSHLPLLQWMSHPASKFYKALAAFQHRTLYANTINDRRTSWYTTSISNTDPFNSMVSESLSAYNMEYIEGYEPTVIDFQKPIEFQRVDRSNRGFCWKRYLFKTFLWSKLIVYAALVSPFYLLYVTGKALWERAKMNKRLNVFSREGAHSLKGLYDVLGETTHNTEIKASSVSSTKISSTSSSSSRNGGSISDDRDRFVPSNFEEQVRDQTELFVDSVFEALNSAKYYDYHHSITKASRLKKAEEAKLLEPQRVVDLNGKSKSDFNLKLTDSQEAIVASLNKLKWKKYPVIIRNTKATHAAVIYRHTDPSFEEGKVVVKHFVEKVFII